MNKAVYKILEVKQRVDSLNLLIHDTPHPKTKYINISKERKDVEYLLIEASGLTNPLSMIASLEQSFGKMTRIRLDSVVTVVDSDVLCAAMSKDDK